MADNKEEFKKRVGTGFGVILEKDGKILLGKRHPDPDKADSAFRSAGEWSLPGGKLDWGETFEEGAMREVKEETNLEAAIKESICTFDELRGSGYFIPDAHRVFTDNVVGVGSRRVTLNDEAEEHMWMPPGAVLRDLDLEPNARITVEQYSKRHLHLA